MRSFLVSSRPPSARRRMLLTGTAVVVLGAFAFTSSAVGSVRPTLSATRSLPAPVVATKRLAAAVTPIASVTTSAPRPAPTTTAPVPEHLAVRVFATGNAQLDALLQTLPAVLFTGKATVHFGYNPVDCCHAGGYNPGPNAVWVSPIAFQSRARLVYVTVHELGHSVHLHSARNAALTAAVAGAPSVRPGSPWDVSEKVADCVAWALFPVQTAASGITYWTCPDPWRSQVRAALAEPVRP